jgi:short-subunit dehydrogenase
MVSSVSGKLAAPFIGGYAASKHGMEGMSDSLRRELMLFGIDVIVVGALLAAATCHFACISCARMRHAMLCFA